LIGKGSVINVSSGVAREVAVGVYTRFKVLLDGSAEISGLHFGSYASALSEMTVHSRADFAVGVFGGWGSGRPR